MAEVRKSSVTGVAIPTTDADRVEIGLAAAGAIVELVRFAVEGRAYVDEAVPALQTRGARVDAVLPESASPEDLSRALHAAAEHIEEARGVFSRRRVRPEVLAPFQRALEAARGNERVTVILQAIHYCGTRGLALPHWLMEAWAVGANRWLGLELGSLDDAFGARKVSSKRLAQHRAKRDRFPALIRALDDATRSGKAFDWARIARAAGASKTVVQEQYYGSPALRAAFPAPGALSRAKRKIPGMTNEK